MAFSFGMKIEKIELKENDFIAFISHNNNYFVCLKQILEAQQIIFHKLIKGGINQ